ncbi:hypothetical protein B0H13DRAFT_2069719 [Mycena leptocephala]|nr:hypothetical protein B0H13DRAFT_2069719 [Mycena leptocephala]
MLDIDDPRCIPHLRALSGTSFVKMRAARSQAPVCGVCTSLVPVGEESVRESVRSASCPQATRGVRGRRWCRHKYSNTRKDGVRQSREPRTGGERFEARRARGGGGERSMRSPAKMKWIAIERTRQIEAQWRPAQPLPSPAGICFDLLQVRTAHPRRNRRLHSGEVAARGCGGKGVRERDASGG